MTNITFIILPIFGIFWLYCLASIIAQTFKNKEHKVFWLVAVLFVPLLSFFYIFLKKDLIESQ